MIPVTVLVPHVAGQLRPQTKAAVLRQCRAARIVEHDAADRESYSRLLIEMCRLPGDLIVVEQDIVPPPGAIAALRRCVHPWCYHMVELRGMLTPATLGLVKFGWRLGHHWGDWMSSALHEGNDPWGRRLMHEPDMAIARWLEIQKVRGHVHFPSPEHLHWPGNHGW